MSRLGRVLLAIAAILLIANALVLAGSGFCAATLRSGVIAAIVGAVFACLGALWLWMLVSATALHTSLIERLGQDQHALRSYKSLLAAISILSVLAAAFSGATLLAMVLRLASGVAVFD